MGQSCSIMDSKGDRDWLVQVSGVEAVRRVVMSVQPSPLGFNPERLAKAIDDLGMPLTELSQKLNCTPRTIENWRKGHTIPRIDKVFLIEKMCAEKDVGEPIYQPPIRQQRLF